MDIVFHTHHAPLSDSMRRRAEQAVRKVARRVARPVDAVVRFEQDGPTRSVEVVLHVASGRTYIARSEARYFGPALSDAVRRVERQVDHTKRSHRAASGTKARAGRPARARA
ncbi:MAG TPA: HPF/RaiA family ribosome-associated protein [Gemmatimonadaceae bacterium]|nr:HPF/RaiA family ribosome-associated protein [Gemmatimonadaceae bacterium]